MQRFAVLRFAGRAGRLTASSRPIDLPAGTAHPFLVGGPGFSAGPGAGEQAMAAVPDDRLGAGTDPVILQESRLWLSVLFGGLLAVLILALVRGMAGAQTAGGRVTVAVIFGAAAVLAAWAWVVVIRRRGHLEITGQAITYAGGKGQPVTLSRQQGDVLRVVARGAPRYSARCLTIQGTSTVIPLSFFFRLSQVRQACTARGWQF
jgi:hypothetical protein